jgi:Tol biopolymer transport system component
VPFDLAAVVRTGGIMVADGGDLVVLDPDAATRTVVQPGIIGSWSPDRQDLAAGLSDPVSNDGLSVLSLDGSNRRQVHLPIPRPSDPAWSPDGRQVAFTVPANNPDTILVVNRDGTGQRQVGRGRYPAWSADGQSIFANTLDDAVQIQRIDVDRGTTAIVPLGPGQHSYPAPGNASLAYADGNTGEIWIAGLDGSDPRPISRCAAPACNGDITPRWSPDGSRLAFVRTTDGGRTAELVVASAVTGAEVARFAAADPQRLFLESWR